MNNEIKHKYRRTTRCRKIDSMGRVVIPKYIREAMDIVTGDILVVEPHGNKKGCIILNKYKQCDER